MTLLGREVPECDAELLFSDIELRFLTDYAADAALPAPRNLAGAVLLVALLGGYQNRNHDPPPGHQLMWRGDPTLADAILDRLVHSSYQLNLKGESMRKRRQPLTQTDHRDS